MTFPTEIEDQVHDLIYQLKRRQIVGSFSTAKETAIILRQVVSTTPWNNADVLLNVIATIGKRLMEAQPNEIAIGNIVKQMLKIIRELSMEDSSSTEKKTQDMYRLKPMIIQEMTEGIIAELDTAYRDIADQALDFISANDVIMTMGQSRTVQEFLIRAAQKINFQVIIAESAPTYQGHNMAISLSKAGIDTTIITDAAVYTMMPHVNKVVLGAHAVLANGALISANGSYLLAASAKHHSKPVLIPTASYKVSPLLSFDEYNTEMSPQRVLSFQSGGIVDKVKIGNPQFDQIESNYINLYIHESGTSPPDLIHRILKDNYDQMDSKSM